MDDNNMTLETLKQAIESIHALPSYVYFISMNTALEMLRTFRKGGLTYKRVNRQNWIRVYSGQYFLADLYIDPFNNLKKGKMGRIEKNKLEIKFERGLKSDHEPFIFDDLRVFRRWRI